MRRTQLGEFLYEPGAATQKAYASIVDVVQLVISENLLLIAIKKLHKIRNNVGAFSGSLCNCLPFDS